MSNTSNTGTDELVHVTGYAPLFAPLTGASMFPTPLSQASGSEWDRTPAPGVPFDMYTHLPVVYGSTEEALAVEGAIACVPAVVDIDNNTYKNTVVLGEPDEENKAKLVAAVEAEINSHLDVVLNSDKVQTVAEATYGAWLLAGTDTMERVEAFYQAIVEERAAAEAAAGAHGQVRIGLLLGGHGLRYGHITTEQIDSVDDAVFVEIVDELNSATGPELLEALRHAMDVDKDAFNAWVNEQAEARDLLLHMDLASNQHTFEDAVKFAFAPFTEQATQAWVQAAIGVEPAAINRLAERSRGRTLEELVEEVDRDTSTWQREAFAAICLEARDVDNIDTLAEVIELGTNVVTALALRCPGEDRYKHQSNVSGAMLQASCA